MPEPQPSDEVDAVTAAGTGDAEFAIVSMSARSPEGDDADYLEWHVLDHLPEQFRIDGLRWGQRWVSTPACRAARSVSEPPFDEVDHVVHYLFARPAGAAAVDPALDVFFALGGSLHQAGRMPLRVPRRHLAGYEIAGGMASPCALVGASVLPFRPIHGVHLVVERWDGDDRPAVVPSPEALLGVDGVAGFWHLRGTSGRHDVVDPADGIHLWVVYLDGDPVDTAGPIADVLGGRWSAPGVTPLLGAPFHVVVPWAWDRALPDRDPEG